MIPWLKRVADGHTYAHTKCTYIGFSVNGMNWNWLVLFLVIFNARHVPVSAAQNSIDQREKLVREWNALGSLSGVRSLSQLAAEYCFPDGHTQPVVTKSKQNLPASAPFYESQYLATPLHVNIFDQICRISSGQGPSVPIPPQLDYNLIHSGIDTCGPAGQPVDLLILINSSPKNVNRRKVLRTTWANNTPWFDARVRHVFLLDNPTADTEQPDDSLSAELAQNSDVVQTDLDSDYLNGTIKLIVAFRWALAFCPQAKWLLFVREDYTVNPYNLISFLISISEAMRQRLIAGSVWDDQPKKEANSFLFPGRNITGAQAEGSYPTFVATSAMLVGSAIARSLYLTMRFTEQIDHPDLFLAAVMHKLLIVPAHVDRFYAYHRRPANEMDKAYALAYIE